MRFMPGTWGTLWGIPAAWLFMRGGAYFYFLASLGLLFFAVLVAELYERVTDRHDPSEVVIDEVTGYVVAMTWLPSTWQAFLGAFLVFRFFDILKPFPISDLDRKIPGGLGTVLDDVAAGLVSNIVLQIVYMQTAWLGVRLGG